MAETFSVISFVINAFNFIRANNEMTKDMKQKAYIALSNAYHRTEAYYSYLAKGNEKNTDQEMEIASLWDIAAMHILPFNEGLANRLGLKSRFWREEMAWTPQQISDANIELRKTREDFRKLLLL